MTLLRLRLAADGSVISYQLNSVLGRSDGNVYENLIDFACREPINAIVRRISFARVVQH